MNETHRIRLRGPWQVAAIECTSDSTLPNPSRMTIPCAWRDGGWVGFRGRALHSRAFGKPTRLDANEHIYLVIEPATGIGVARLNGQVLGELRADSTIESDVTGLLKLRNLLEIEIAADHDGGGVTGEVSLEIRRMTASEN